MPAPLSDGGGGDGRGATSAARASVPGHVSDENATVTKSANASRQEDAWLSARASDVDQRDSADERTSTASGISGEDGGIREHASMRARLLRAHAQTETPTRFSGP
jgi:hypothetical protein